MKNRFFQKIGLFSNVVVFAALILVKEAAVKTKITLCWEKFCITFIKEGGI